MSKKIKMRVSRRRRARQLTKLLFSLEKAKSMMRAAAFMRDFGHITYSPDIYQSVRDASGYGQLAVAHTAWLESERIRQTVDLSTSWENHDGTGHTSFYQIARAANTYRDIVAKADEIRRAEAFIHGSGRIPNGSKIDRLVQDALASNHSTAAQTAWHDFERIRRRVDSPEFLDNYDEKIKAFQHEVERAASANAYRDVAAQAAEIKKAEAFMRLRDQNYEASLRLEGLLPAQYDALTTLTALHSKYAR